MIHIMHILYCFNFGGIENIIADLINNMDDEKFSHAICVFSSRINSIEKIKNNENKNIFIIKRRFRHDPTVILRLVLLLKKERPDIVATYNWAGVEGIIAAKLAGIKHIIHAEHGFDSPEILKQKKRRIFARRIILRYCDRVIAICKFLRDWLIEKVGLENSKIIYLLNGCDTKIFFPGRDEAKRKELGIQDNEIVIGIVGTLKEVKNQESLILAFAKLSKSHNNLKLLIVGDGPKRQGLESLVTKIGLTDRVNFVGGVINSAVFYRAMDVFATVSLMEFAPIVLLEAMASGLPIIAPDVGDIKYMLDGEKGGIIIKPKDIDSIVEGIEYFIKNKQAAKEKGSFVRQRAEELFNLERMVSEYEKLYLGVLENKRS